ncbi:LOW QUALITY PROTEIN: transmembrane protein 26 [Chrysoperla carnea]|uniref:LOW QUALITY PROTEIN: transmembrane protein 26 n=1 Tax=Chrysoperla carnea TaxID=189513 RepID=UPI001D0636F0|nr:LOW QUALITY PROTEIN: transmembrane protein 26 [Chrysoperla carnea]
MANCIDTIKAIITRLVFGGHGFVAIWQVTYFKKNPLYWYLSTPMLLLFFEGIFTLTIKKIKNGNAVDKVWFCPSVFLYLSSVVPAIWLLELDKVDKRLQIREETLNLTATADLKELHKLLGVQFPVKFPEINLNTETWVTLIEQFLMLILIIGRWMLPKGDLTRDQLSQLLLVYIGTAADIIEFFDSFKDEKIASEQLLVMLTLGIWSWSLMQFTVVLTATKSRKSRLSSNGAMNAEIANCCCCNIDVWGIALNIILQDAPFLAFRLLIIIHYEIISYMNVFFTCKNTLVILLQLYRLYVVYSENHQPKSSKQRSKRDFELSTISIIAKSHLDSNIGNNPHCKRVNKQRVIADKDAIRAIKNYIIESDKSSGYEKRSQIHKGRSRSGINQEGIVLTRNRKILKVNRKNKTENQSTKM